MGKKSTYNAEADVMVGRDSIPTYDNDNTTKTLEVGLFSYNGGESKVQLSRKQVFKADGKEINLKLGRVSLDEFSSIAKIVKKLTK